MPPAEDEKKASADKDEDKSEKKPYLTQEEFDAKLNKAITTHTKRIEKSYEEKFKALEDRLEKMSKKPSADDDIDEEAEQGSQQGQGSQNSGQSTQALSPQDAAWKRAMERKLAKERAEREKDRAEREKERAEREREEERSSLQTELVAAGANPARIKAAIAILHTEDKRVRRNADGKVVFVVDDEEMDLKAGVKAWLSTDEGKDYLPAKGVGGSGNLGGSPGKKMNAPHDKRSLADAALVKALLG